MHYNKLARVKESPRADPAKCAKKEIKYPETLFKTV
jgi:hypothetical protein